MFILDLIFAVCLDTNYIKPITYKNIVDEKMEISLPSRIESVEQAASETAEFAKKSGLGDDVLFAIDMAVRESVANAIKHGNKFDETKSVAAYALQILRTVSRSR